MKLTPSDVRGAILGSMDFGHIPAPVLNPSFRISNRLIHRLFKEHERRLNEFMHQICDHIYEFPRALPIELKGIAV